MATTGPFETLKRNWHIISEPERRALLEMLHPHLKAQNVNEQEEQRLTRGDRIADSVTSLLGSWRFMIVQSVLLTVWVVLNVIGWIHRWDPYPFILLNLALSFQAAYSAPIIMMSQNRQMVKDRLVAANDYTVNQRAELEVAAIQSRLNELAGLQWDTLIEMQRRQIELLELIHDLASELHRRSPAA